MPSPFDLRIYSSGFSFYLILLCSHILMGSVQILGLVPHQEQLQLHYDVLNDLLAKKIAVLHSTSTFNSRDHHGLS